MLSLLKGISPVVYIFIAGLFCDSITKLSNFITIFLCLAFTIMLFVVAPVRVYVPSFVIL